MDRMNLGAPGRRRDGAARIQVHAIHIREAALDGSGRPMGNLALASRRMDTRFRDHHNNAE